MVVIHIFHVLTKLFTLKHSCFLFDFTLKRSWKYAETLLLSIYTCIYLYKNTCSWQPQAVGNFFKKILAIFLLANSFLLSGCQKSVYLCEQPIRQLSVKEIPAASTHPAQFYLCGSIHYPCSVTNYRQYVPLHYSMSSHHPQKRKAYEKPITKQACVFK